MCGDMIGHYDRIVKLVGEGWRDAIGVLRIRFYLTVTEQNEQR